ncbi:MAG: DUF790 family protein [Candidatus Bathyarchaeota archaeon]|nr:DUF790 family protein [Candidatus Bathyarchaeota archaeon]
MSQRKRRKWRLADAEKEKIAKTPEVDAWLLPSELLRVNVWRGNIRPKYSSFSSLELQAAEEVVKAYATNVGIKRGLIRERVLELEDAYGFKLVRGLALLVERRCIFASEAPFNPVQARHVAFAEAARAGLPATEEARRRILASAAQQLNVSPSQLDEALYADLDVEAVLKSAVDLKPLDLLKMYNLSVTQTLLFRATEISFSGAGNWQRVFRAIKYYGLMYSVTRQYGMINVKVDGAASLFKLTKRYGTCLAKLLPEILRVPSWRLEAKILRNNSLLNFNLDSGKHGWLFPAEAVGESFDSKVEADFAVKFKSLGSAWTLQREPEPLQAGASVFIPDFVFALGDARVYMEVVGFWTREYLKRKLEKLGEVKDKTLIVTVDQTLACDKIAELKTANPRVHVIWFKGNIPIREVLRVLEPLAAEAVNAQAKELKLNVEEPIALLKELADRYNVAIEAVRQATARLDSHVLIGEALVAKALLDEAKRVLQKELKEQTPLPVALKLLDAYCFPDPLAVLAYCGFQIKWQGLLPADAVVSRRPQV